VWNGSNSVEQLVINSGSSEDALPSLEAPHLGAVNALVIDDRTKHLFSGDSVGVILVWRQDVQGAYQLLRRFRQDDLDGKKILSMHIHPERSKAQLLVFAAESLMRFYSLTTYKSQSSFGGAYVSGSFSRASISADGRYIISGTEDARIHLGEVSDSDARSFLLSSSSKPSRLKVWDTLSGNTVSCPLSDICLPYMVRAISWNKNQHMIAVTTAGTGASVAIYVSEKESALKALERVDQNAASDYFQLIQEKVDAMREGNIEADLTGLKTVERPTITNRILPSASHNSGTTLDNPEERKLKTQLIIQRMREKRALATINSS
jgi:WD40 repeat protein